MATAITNYSNTDIVDFTVEQSSTSRTEIFTEEPILDATKDYVVSVTEMAVPLSEEPMITWRLTVQTLLVIRRRKIGAQPNGLEDEVNAAYHPNLTLQEDMKMYTPSDFLAIVASWASLFSRKCYEIGFPADYVNVEIVANFNTEATSINPAQNNSLLSVSLTPSGVVQLKGSHTFWQNFYIVPYPYGQQLFGFSRDLILFTGTEPDPAELITAGVITASQIANARTKITYQGDYSVFRFLEERMYISIEAGDLALPFNQLIRDGVETKSHSLATFPFETNYKTTIKTENGRIQSSIELEMDTHISRTHFQSKTDPTFSWHLLTSSYMVQNMRLELFITRRRWNEHTHEWYYSKEPVKIHEDGVWNTSLKFISVH